MWQGKVVSLKHPRIELPVLKTNKAQSQITQEVTTVDIDYQASTRITEIHLRGNMEKFL